MASGDTNGWNGPARGRGKAMQAITRLYAAGMMTGVRSMTDSFELLSESMLQYQRHFWNTDGPADRAARQNDPDRWWESTIRNSIDDYRVKTETIYRQADIRYALKAKEILDDVYGG